jgi:hypothetical protein
MIPSSGIMCHTTIGVIVTKERYDTSRPKTQEDSTC